MFAYQQNQGQKVLTSENSKENDEVSQQEYSSFQFTDYQLHDANNNMIKNHSKHESIQFNNHQTPSLISLLKKYQLKTEELTKFESNVSSFHPFLHERPSNQMENMNCFSSFQRSHNYQHTRELSMIEREIYEYIENVALSSFLRSEQQQHQKEYLDSNSNIPVLRQKPNTKSKFSMFSNIKIIIPPSNDNKNIIEFGKHPYIQSSSRTNSTVSVIDSPSASLPMNNSSTSPVDYTKDLTPSYDKNIVTKSSSKSNIPLINVRKVTKLIKVQSSFPFNLDNLLIVDPFDCFHFSAEQKKKNEALLKEKRENASLFTYLDLEVEAKLKSQPGTYTGYLILKPSIDHLKNKAPLSSDEQEEEKCLIIRQLMLIVTFPQEQFVWDVYSKPFIPQSTLDILNHPVSFIPGTPPFFPNVHQYRLSLAPKDLVDSALRSFSTNPVDTWITDMSLNSENAYVPSSFSLRNSSPSTAFQAPPPVHLDIFSGSHMHDLEKLEPISLDMSNYVERFKTSLIEETRTRVEEADQYTLYDVKLNYHVESQCHVIHVPGITDGAPSLNVSDTVLIRRMHFDGAEWQGFIHSFVRRTGQVYVKFSGLQVINNESFIVRFRLNLAKTAMSLRAMKNVTELNEDVAFPSKQWLFPSHADIPLKRTTSSINPCKNEQYSTYSDIKRYGDIDSSSMSSVQHFEDNELNEEQKEAVNQVIRRPFGSVPYLIWGPAGTGKTKTLVEAIIQILKTSSDHRVLVTAPSHSAADTLALRLIKKLDSSNLFRFYGPTTLLGQVPSELLPFTLLNSNSQFDLPPAKQFLKYKVVILTCEDCSILEDAGLANSNLQKIDLIFQSYLKHSFPHLNVHFKPKLHWTHLLVDEAAQASEPETMICLSLMRPLYKPTNFMNSHEGPVLEPTIVLCGDHRQLGPVIQSVRAKRMGLEMSWFERLFQQEVYKLHPENKFPFSNDSAIAVDGHHHRDAHENLNLQESNISNIQAFKKKMANNRALCFTILVKNYRSHPEMLKLPSELFYNNLLCPSAPGSLIFQYTQLNVLPNPNVPMAFYSVEGLDMAADDSGSAWFNPDEVLMVADLIQRVLDQKISTQLSDFGVISPFREQVKRIRSILRHRGLGRIDVGTVEDYQGMERKIIILSTVRSRRQFIPNDVQRGIGLMYFPKRFNVAITRSQCLLLIVGNPHLLVNDENWFKLLHHYNKLNLIVGKDLPHRIMTTKYLSNESVDHHPVTEMLQHLGIN